MRRTLLTALVATFICTQAAAQSAPVEIAPSPVVPASAPDPLAPARAALAFAAEGEKCRFAFSQKAVSDPRATWASAGTALRFDPRWPVGSRYKVVGGMLSAVGSRAFLKQDALGKPDDLTALLPEGAYKIANLALVKGGPDSESFAFTLEPIAARAANKDSVKLITSQTGALALDRDTWRITSVTLRVLPEGVRLGVTKIKSGSTTLSYSVLRDRFVLADRRIEVRGTSRGSTTIGAVYGDIEPICDAGEVARISDTEAAVQSKKSR